MVLIAMILSLFMIAAAFTIDVAYVHLAKTELRTATDAAAKAAAQEFARSRDVADAIRVGREVAASNKVTGTPLALSQGDFTFGRCEENLEGRYEFSQRAGGGPPNSVRVTGQRTVGSRGGHIPRMLVSYFGVANIEPTSTATVTYIDRDVVLVIDRSESMAGQKTIDLRMAIAEFIATLDQSPVEELVGMASYSDTAGVDVVMTADRSIVPSALAKLPIVGPTSISAGIEAGGVALRSGRSSALVERTMVVMTGGRHIRGEDPRITAQRLADAGVTIHTISLGEQADCDVMRDVARIAGGRYFHADTGSELQRIYRDLALSLRTIITQ